MLRIDSSTTATTEVVTVTDVEWQSSRREAAVDNSTVTEPGDNASTPEFASTTTQGSN